MEGIKERKKTKNEGNKVKEKKERTKKQTRTKKRNEQKQEKKKKKGKRDGRQIFSSIRLPHYIVCVLIPHSVTRLIAKHGCTSFKLRPSVQIIKKSASD